MKFLEDIIRGSVTHKKLVYATVMMLVALGVVGLVRMNKDEFPTFEIKQGLVAGIYPGATAREVEEQLTDPLEHVLFSFPEVIRENTTSVSKDGVCYIFVDIDVEPERKVEIWSKIKLKLQDQKLLLPAGVIAVAVVDDFSAVSSVLVAIESDDKGWTEMKYYADLLCHRLRKIPELANVSVLGTQTEEIAVTIDPDKLSAYGITPSSLLLEYQTASIPSPSGSFRGSDVHVLGQVTGEQEVADRIVWMDPRGNNIRLKDIATIERRYKAPSSYVSYNGNTALVLSIEMRPDNNIVAFGYEVDKVLEDFSKDLPKSVQMNRVTDQPKVVRESVMSFLRDLGVSMLVVVLVMLLLFPLRSALIASSGVPVCTAVSVAVMYVLGIPLNTVTLAGLIVVLGMIVDDSIITMDGYMVKLGNRLSPLDAAGASANELFMPMFMATFAICAMFYPSMGIITGYLGDFIRYFPWVISIALTTSLAYAVFVVPSLEVTFIGTRIAERQNFFTRLQRKFFFILQRIYDKSLEACFRHPALTVSAAVLAVALGVLMFTQLNVQMMPMAARDLFVAEVTLEGGAELDRTKALTDSLTQVLLEDGRVGSVTSFVGTGAPRFHATYSPLLPAPNCAQVIVNTTSNKATEDMLRECEGLYENYFPEALVRFKQMDYQGTVPVSVTFTGAAAEQMKPYADSLKNFMYGMSDQLKWVHSDIEEQVSKVDITLDPEETARLGVNKTLLSLFLSGASAGQTIATVWEKGEKVPVNVYRSSYGNDPRYDDFANQMIPTSIPGVYVPLRQVATLTPSWELSQISHVDGEEAVTVYADMKSGHSHPVAMKQIQAYVNNMNLPSDVMVQYGGLSQSNARLIPEIGLTFVSAVVVLFIFLLIHFRKVSLSILTLVLSLLCFFGAFFGLWIFGVDFSMTAVLGLISLVGIIVRNGIIMFDYAEELRFSSGYSVLDAAMEAGKRRMRPIFLTSCTTALGVLPMILSGDLLWLPMGVVICFGTMLSIVLIVLIMPVSYWCIFRKHQQA